jgi:AcrR family transcriptional regulator
MAETARERLLSAAGRLFGTQGINSTGIDRIIAEAGVAKASLYGNFSGKDELVEAYLQTRLDAWRGVVARIAASSVKPATKVRRLFEATIPMEFFGCPFTNAIVEQPDNPGVRRVVAEYRRDLHDAVGTFIGRPAGHESVTAIVLTLDGAVAAAKMHDPRITTDTALAVAVRNVAR